MTSKYPQKPFGDLQPGTMFTRQGSAVHIKIKWPGMPDREELGDVFAADCTNGLISRWGPELLVTVVKDPVLAFGLEKKK